MKTEIEEYLTNLSALLNSQLRGAINRKAKEENLELIQLTFRDIYNELYSYISSEFQKTSILLNNKEDNNE